MKTFNLGELRVRERDLGEEYYVRRPMWQVCLVGILLGVLLGLALFQ